MTANLLDQCLADWRQIVTPRPKRNIWQWADENRFLAKGVSAASRHGDARFSSDLAPHQKGIMESFLDPDVQTTVMLGASQVMGKTEIFNNVIGYFMDYRPTNVIVMYPTIDSAEKFSKKKFTPMCRATPALDRLLPNSRSRDSGNTILVKDYTGGSVFFVGANSAASLRGASGEVLLADEIDSNEPGAGEEGDSVDLLFKRGESFGTAVQGLASTPTIEGHSKIWSWFERSDQRFWFVPCPHCGVRGIFKWSQMSSVKVGPAFFMDWPRGEPEKASLVCASCAKSVNDKQRLDSYYDGAWEATAPFTGVRGFHLNWIYCPWPAKKGYKNRLHQMASQWEDAKRRGSESMKVIITTGLTECWKEKLEKAPEWDSLHRRCYAYDSKIPAAVVYLTASVDTQSDRLEYEIQGWGIGEECFGIETGKIFGNPHGSAPWEKLDTLLTQTFQHPCGAWLKISCTLIDSGGQSDAKAFSTPVYNYVLKRQWRHIYACKGSSVLGAKLIEAREQKNGILLQFVGTDELKTMVYERLAITDHGPGYCHFPAGGEYTEEFFRQMVSESVSLNKGKREWVKLRDRNEALDLRVYGYAAFKLRNVNLEAVSQSIYARAKADQEQGPPGTPEIQKATEARPNRRVASFVKW